MKKTFKFTFDMKTEQDVIQILESIPKVLRSQYIVEVIRFTKSKLLECSLVNNTDTIVNEPVKRDEPDKTEQESNQEKSKKKFDISKLLGGF
jgi:predicted proteasome-type protease